MIHDYNLSDNFKYKELIYSDTAIKEEIDNTPHYEEASSLMQLCIYVLQPTRNHFSKSMNITSGYRCPSLNKVVGGVSNSQHVYGEAADFQMRGKDLYNVAKWISDNLDVDQVILENYGTGREWIHVSYSSPITNRNEALTLKEGKYLDGIVK